MQELDSILKTAEGYMKRADIKKKHSDRAVHPEVANGGYTTAVYYGLKALYEQNKVVIELLKKKEEKT